LAGELPDTGKVMSQQIRLSGEQATIDGEGSDTGAILNAPLDFTASSIICSIRPQVDSSTKGQPKITACSERGVQ
jgi:hypothetical protein